MFAEGGVGLSPQPARPQTWQVLRQQVEVPHELHTQLRPVKLYAVCITVGCKNRAEMQLSHLWVEGRHPLPDSQTSASEEPHPRPVLVQPLPLLAQVGRRHPARPSNERPHKRPLNSAQPRDMPQPTLRQRKVKIGLYGLEKFEIYRWVEPLVHGPASRPSAEQVRELCEERLHPWIPPQVAAEGLPALGRRRQLGGRLWGALAPAARSQQFLILDRVRLSRPVQSFPRARLTRLPPAPRGALARD
mmetsp:Transcript_10241/g.24633  ORF Transcript_10241/g.24633 Transcript_10241/m.24633 type:complete len:246 (+) Transcript_10241:859-1596(+)